MEARRSEIVSGVLVIVAMLVLVVPRVAFPMNDPTPSVFGIDMVVWLAAVPIVLAIGNIARHVRASR